MAHELILSIQDNPNDNRFLSITDLSVYDLNIPVTNPVLLAKIPGQDEYFITNFVLNSTTNYTTKSLHRSTCVEILPDGLYQFTFSVCPNDDVYTNQSHFRASTLEWDIKTTMSKLSINTYDEFDIDDCGNIKLDKEKNRLITLLYQLKAIEGAMLNDDYWKALELYKYVKTQFEKHFKSYCNFCT